MHSQHQLCWVGLHRMGVGSHEEQDERRRQAPRQLRLSQRQAQQIAQDLGQAGSW
jgi:hypothetical protein